MLETPAVVHRLKNTAKEQADEREREHREKGQKKRREKERSEEEKRKEEEAKNNYGRSLDEVTRNRKTRIQETHCHVHLCRFLYECDIRILAEMRARQP